MVTVHYEFEFPYDQDRGRPAPMVVCWVSVPETPRRGVFTKLLLDTGGGQPLRVEPGRRSRNRPELGS